MGCGCKHGEALDREPTAGDWRQYLENPTHVSSYVRDEMPDIVERALRAGARAPLEYQGAGMTAVVLCDANNRAWKVARHFDPDERPRNDVFTLDDEAEWLETAAEVPGVREHVARIVKYHPELAVIERECVIGRNGHYYRGSLVDLHNDLGRKMAAHGWRMPEFKEDSYVLRESDGAPILVDASSPIRIGNRQLEYVRDILDGRREARKTDRDLSLSWTIEAEKSSGRIRPEDADEVLQRLQERGIAMPRELDPEYLAESAQRVIRIMRGARTFQDAREHFFYMYLKESLREAIRLLGGRKFPKSATREVLEAELERLWPVAKSYGEALPREDIRGGDDPTNIEKHAWKRRLQRELVDTFGVPRENAKRIGARLAREALDVFDRAAGREDVFPAMVERFEWLSLEGLDRMAIRTMATIAEKLTRGVPELGEAMPADAAPLPWRGPTAINRALAPSGWQLIEVTIDRPPGSVRVVAERRGQDRGERVTLVRNREGDQVIERHEVIERRPGPRGDSRWWATSQSGQASRHDNVRRALRSLGEHIEDYPQSGYARVPAASLLLPLESARPPERGEACPRECSKCGHPKQDDEQLENLSDELVKVGSALELLGLPSMWDRSDDDILKGADRYNDELEERIMREEDDEYRRTVQDRWRRQDRVAELARAPQDLIGPLTYPPGGKQLVSRDPSGGWRVTRFNRRMRPIGHFGPTSFPKAVDQASQEGDIAEFRPVTSAEAGEALPREKRAVSSAFAFKVGDYKGIYTPGYRYHDRRGFPLLMLMKWIPGPHPRPEGYLDIVRIEGDEYLDIPRPAGHGPMVSEPGYMLMGEYAMTARDGETPAFLSDLWPRSFMNWELTRDPETKAWLDARQLNRQPRFLQYHDLHQNSDEVRIIDALERALTDEAQRYPFVFERQNDRWFEPVSRERRAPDPYRGVSSPVDEVDEDVPRRAGEGMPGDGHRFTLEEDEVARKIAQGYMDREDMDPQRALSIGYATVQKRRRG